MVRFIMSLAAGLTLKSKKAREIERQGGEDWVLRVPQATRDSGIRDFEKAVESGEAKKTEQQVSGKDQLNEQLNFVLARTNPRLSK